MTHPNRRYDPVGAVEIERAKHAAAINEFHARTVSDDVFRATIFGLGYRGAALASEFRYQDDLRHENETRVKGKIAILRSALLLAENVLSRAPLSTQIWPDGKHPNEGIQQIRDALAKTEN